jgi:phage shock protein E
MFKIFVIGVCLVSGQIYEVANVQDKIYENLSAGQFKSSLDLISDEVLLDVRTPAEAYSGIIKGATVFDYFKKDFEKRVAKLDPNRTYFLYCETGGRSTKTLELMKKLGFKEVYNLQGGFDGWKKQKMPVQPFKE